MLRHLIHHASLHRASVCGSQANVCKFSSMMFNTDFDIRQKPFWQKIEGCPSVNEVAARITDMRGSMSTKISEKPQLARIYAAFHYRNYLYECITGETDLNLSYDDLIALLKAGFFLSTYYRIFDRRTYSLKLTLQNVYGAIQTQFPDPFCLKSYPFESFDLEFVKSLHHQIGKGVIPDAGVLRTLPAWPDGMKFFYLAPSEIEHHLKILLEESKLILRDPKPDLLPTVKLAACFLSNFLYIHPFSDGNGRTARLLLSHLLKTVTILPLSLFSSGYMRDVYLLCLRAADDSRHNGAIVAPDLSRFILDAIFLEYKLFHDILIELEK